MPRYEIRQARGIPRVKGYDIPRRKDPRMTLKKWAVLQGYKVIQVFGRLAMVERRSPTTDGARPMPFWVEMPSYVVDASAIPATEKAGERCGCCRKVGGHYQNCVTLFMHFADE